MYFTLPDLPKLCPFSSSFNPHFESVASESKAWIDSFGILSGPQRRFFSTSAFELLAAHAYPYADRDGYRTSCDYMNLTFLLDDYSDDEGRRGPWDGGFVYERVEGSQLERWDGFRQASSRVRGKTEHGC